MSVLRSLESKLAGLVEGTFSRAFKSEVRPVEIARKLAKEMDEHKVQSLSRVYAPNDYTVWLSPKDREQFDKPLGAFQAIAHYLSDASTAVNGGRILVYEAAWALSEGRSIDSLAPMAKLFACQTFRDSTAMAQQVWGGVGFTLEYDIQLYFRRAKALQISWLDDVALREMVAAEVLD